MRTISALAFDCRYAIRSLRSTPAVTLTALLVLTLGIGAGTAIFAVVDGVVLQGLPFRDEATLVAVNETDLSTGRPQPAAYQNFVDWTARQDVFADMAASENWVWLTLANTDTPRRFRSHRITANLFDLLGVRPLIGAGFTRDDERAGARVAIISHAMWQELFNGDAGALGRTIHFEGGEYSVAAVMPRGFRYPIGSAALSDVDLWIPLTPASSYLTRSKSRTYGLRVVARLAAGASVETASVRMAQIRDAMAAETPHWFTDRGILVRPIKDSIVGANVRSWMIMLLVAVATVFLIACANVANLLLARAAGRNRETGVRAAMGATRWRIIRASIVEGTVLALAGAAGGLVVAYWGVDVLRATLPKELPRIWDIAVDLRVTAVAALVAVVTGTVCGLLPAIQMSSMDVSSSLRGEGRTASASQSRQRLRTVFLAVEVALAAVLVVGSTLFAASYWRVITRELGFDAANVLHFDVSPPRRAGETFAESQQRFHWSMQSVLEKVRPLPGVQSAALIAGGAPLTGSYATLDVRASERTFSDDDAVVLKQVTPGYFDTIGATLLRGRSLDGGDTPGSPMVAVLSDEAARRYFGTTDPVGAQITFEQDSPRTVVGIIRGMRLFGPESDVRPEAYVPYAQSSRHSISPSVVLRTTPDPAGLFPAVREAVSRVMPGAVIHEPQTFQQMYGSLVAQRKLNMILIGIFGALALLIASIGIYGTLAYAVEGRTKEIGVRMALGAMPSAILRMVLTSAALTIGVGLATGFLVAVWLERLAAAFVFRGVPRDPIVYGSAALLLTSVGLLAALIPARRAARVDPLIALRAE